MSQLSLMIDLERCIGCKSCEAACKAEHGLGPTENRNRVVWLAHHDKPGLDFLTLSCQHCERPACVRACPVNPKAINKHPQTGVVEIDERQVTYLSAFGGGAVSLDDLTDIWIASPTQLVSAAQPYHDRPLSRLWILRDSLGSEVQIPMDATNVDALVEAMLNLPQTQSALIYQAMRAEGGQPVVIWRRETSPLH